MADSFQAFPPADSNPGLKPYERFGDIDLRKPERRSILRRLLISSPLALGIAAFLFWLFLYRWSAVTSPSPSSVRLDTWPTEETALQGTWVATAMIINGEEASTADARRVELKLMQKPGRFRLTLPNKMYHGQYKASGGEIDLNDDTPIFGVRGIYIQDGDKLAICFEETKRPTEFTAEKGSRRTLLMLTRHGKEP